MTTTDTHARNDALDPDQTPPGEAAQPDEVSTIEIRTIDRPPNQRLEELADAQRLQELAESMRVHGQEQPVRVYRKLPAEAEGAHRPSNGRPYVLGYGYRRVAAAELLGWSQIRAEIHPPAADADIEAARAAENLHRQDLNVMEEALAVSNSIAAREAGAGSREQAIAQVARDLGKSETWVRDRQYMTRISDDVKRLALAGLLLPGHVRELAKVGDEAQQFGVAEAALIGAGMVRPVKKKDRQRAADRLANEASDGSARRLSVERVRALVDQLRRPLKRVPWDLSLPVAGQCACAGCPDNTATDQTLFGGDGGAPEDGQCMNEHCYQLKLTKSEQAKKKVVEKLKKKQAEPSADAVDNARPDWLKRGPAQREAKKELGAPKKKTAKKKTAGKGAGQSTPPAATKADREREARRKWHWAINQWSESIQQQIDGLVVRNPAHLPGLLLLDVDHRWNNQPDDFVLDPRELPTAFKALPAEVARLIDTAVQPTTDDRLIAQATEVVKSDNNLVPDRIQMICDDAGVRAIEHLARKLGLDPPPPPTWDQFAPAPSDDGDANDQASAQGGASKRAAKKKKTAGKKKAVKRKAVKKKAARKKAARKKVSKKKANGAKG